MRISPIRQGVDFVLHHDIRGVSGADVMEHGLDDGALLLVQGMRHVDDAQQEIGRAHLFERALERLDERMGNLIDEADGVGQHHALAARQAQRAYRWIERREELVLGDDPGVRQRVHQRRFTRIRIAHERHRGVRHFEPLAALDRAGLLNGREALLQLSDPLADTAAIDLELRLAGAARADAAAQARQVRPLARQPRAHVFELRELDLELALIAARALRENIENQLAPVDHAKLERALEVALLRGCQVFVKNDEIGLRFLDGGADLLDLAAADERRGRDLSERLGKSPDDVRAGALGQFLQLVEIVVERRVRRARRQLRADEKHAFAETLELRVNAFQDEPGEKLTRSPKICSTVSSSSGLEETRRSSASMIASVWSGEKKCSDTGEVPGGRPRLSCSSPSSPGENPAPRKKTCPRPPLSLLRAGGRRRDASSS